MNMKLSAITLALWAVGHVGLAEAPLPSQQGDILIDFTRFEASSAKANALQEKKGDPNALLRDLRELAAKKQVKVASLPTIKTITARVENASGNGMTVGLEAIIDWQDRSIVSLNAVLDEGDQRLVSSAGRVKVGEPMLMGSYPVKNGSTVFVFVACAVKDPKANAGAEVAVKATPAPAGSWMWKGRDDSKTRR